MAVRNRALAWLQSSAAVLAVACTLIWQPVAVSRAEETIPAPVPGPSASAQSATPSGSAVPDDPPAPGESAAPGPTQATEQTGPAETPVVAESVESSGSVFASGSGSFVVKNGFLTYYRASGAQTGALGYPLSGEIPAANGGVCQVFQGGTLWWSPHTDVVLTRNGMHSEYQRLGSESGQLGYPTGDERATHGGYVQIFQGGTLWYRNGVVYLTKSGFDNYVRGQGLDWGQLGFPVTDEGAARDGGAWQRFENGLLMWHRFTDVAKVSNGFGQYFAGQGHEWGQLGYPVGDERATRDGGRVQDFQNGVLFWSAGSDVHKTMNGFRSAYGQRGWEWSWLGYPASEEYWNGVGVVQDFQGGTMYYDRVGLTVTPGTRALEWGYTQLGKPYAMGATGPNAYDCSGFTQAAFGAVGVSIPRTSYSQPTAGISVPYESLEPGDLVFSYGYGHVAIYAGDGKVINALSYGTPLSITPLYGGFSGAVRVVR